MTKGTPPKKQFKILDRSPLSINRPLRLLDSFAYAATWLDVEISDGTDKWIEKHLFIIRDDGVVVFTDLIDPQFDDIKNIGPEVNLCEIPRPGTLWSGDGVKRFMRGDRPDPFQVFYKVVEVIDHFIDFDSSFGGQREMSELVACYVLGTWFLDAFNVMGILWSSGERGSGKTHLLVTVTEFSYLGEVMHATGTYASLRDLADYGATLAFDDAENLSDPRHADPDKRTLLLAGNRRGTYVSLKDQVNGKKWKLRHTHAYSPKLISAINLPDPVLASRTLVIPLVRSVDSRKSNSDPQDFELWPHDRCKLVDELWALAVSCLPDIPKYDRDLVKHVRLNGRKLQPWRAILAIARWLDDNGVQGLWDRMENLSWDYHTLEHSTLQTGDLSTLVLRALLESAICANKAMGANKPEWYFSTAEITDHARKIAEREEIDLDLNRVTSRRVGRILSNMRFEPARPDGSKGRGWRILRSVLISRCTSYGISIPPEIQNDTNQENSVDSSLPIEGINETNGTNELISNIGD